MRKSGLIKPGRYISIVIVNLKSLYFKSTVVSLGSAVRDGETDLEVSHTLLAVLKSILNVNMHRPYTQTPFLLDCDGEKCCWFLWTWKARLAALQCK